MKRIIKIGVTVFLSAVLLNGMQSCSENIFPKIPTLATAEVTAITETSAVSGGKVWDDGGAAVTDRGVCWGTTPYPTIASSRTSDGDGVGNFTSLITGLSDNTLYYLRAYATNKAGTNYGLQISFTTSAHNP